MPDFQFEVASEIEAANAVTVTVANPPPPVEYNAAGITSFRLTVQSVLALAMRSRTRRLTHDDQVSRPGRADDEGFVHADKIETGQYVFFTANKQRSG